MDRRKFMKLTFSGLASSAAWPALAQTNKARMETPEDIVRWIYAEAVKKEKDGSQKGGTIFGGKGPIRRLFSVAFLREWDAAQARIKKSGDLGLDFDPVSNSQDPSIGKVEFKIENESAGKTRVAATFGSLEDPKAAPQTVRYDCVREGNAWKLDDIAGSVEQDPWSLRGLMKEWK